MSTSAPSVTDLSPDELRVFVEQAGAELESAHPEEILAWAARTFGSDLVLASSMGDEVLVHMAAKVAPGMEVIFLDTGYHFAETIGTRNYYADFTDIRLRTILPLRTVQQQDDEHGPRLHERDPNLCCALRKVEPLERGLAPYGAWITGMRREDAPTRTDIPVVGWDAKRGKVKLNPLAAWTQEQVDAYVDAEHVVLNPLRQAGYTSIGCAPCTRAVLPGEDARAGRWSGTGKVECGLHI
ncbi:phosphoadenylyl-sulfate reductase [Cellulomonas composti]|uniref:Adenosine 5'-phosphosulfate reductase n=1 Tax=Cellulomonas composti TaxID=266130 RepID=A0A511J6U5_9CELL|nr:phosphoadenylyl-sulfate reductase [Cellulomonas composti]GEL93742.1 phosphoadenosine phosphosulfate reductase [Cellulomonas composti]